MSLSEINMIGLSIITSLGGAGLILFAFSSWLGKVWANRILESEKNKYVLEMESIKTDNQNFINALSVSNSSYIESRKVFTIERIQAIKLLWEEVITIRDNRPSAMTFLDILTFEEYGQIHGNTKLKFFDEELSSEKIAGNTNSNVDKVRPFIDEKAFAYFWSYRALVGRLSFYVQQIRKNGKPKKTWHEDNGILQILQPILESTEIERFKNDKWGTIILFGYIETALANHLKELASGADLAKESLGHSLTLYESAFKLRKIQEEENS